MATLKTKLYLRNDTTANWTANSTIVLGKGEVGIEWTTSGSPKIKIGDGTTTWADLNYFGGSFTITGTGNTIVNATYSAETGVLTLTKGDRLTGSGLTANTVLLGNGGVDVKTSSKTITTTLGSDDTTIPTSGAVKDALDDIIGDLVTGVSSVTVTDDDVIIGSPATATTGAVTIDVKHATKGPSTTSDTTKGATADVNVNGSGATGSIKIPKVTVDKYGHTTGLTEQTLSITMPNTTNMVTGTGLTADTIILGSGNSGVKTSSKKITTTLGSDDTTVPTSKAVTTAIAAATNAAVVMRGTLGTGGTITALPTASASTLGDAYKVITAGTYAEQSAKVGDVFICYQPTGSTTYSWMLIPSGDDIEDTWRAIQVNGTQILGTGTSTGVLNLKAGSNVTLTNSGGTVTIASSYTNNRDAGYGKITPSNSTATTAVTGNTTQTVATTYSEDIDFKAGNKWIVLAGANSNTADSDSITWGHSLSGITAGSFGPTANVTGNNDSTIKVPQITVDAAGHITGVSERTLTLKNTTYGIVSTSADGLAPKMTTNNAFLMRVGNASAPTWNAITILDGGGASTTDWGTITA